MDDPLISQLLSPLQNAYGESDLVLMKKVTIPSGLTMWHINSF